MRAESVYEIAIHLPDKELEKLLLLLNKKVNPHLRSTPKKRQLLSDKQAIDYLLENVFRKVY